MRFELEHFCRKCNCLMALHDTEGLCLDCAHQGAHCVSEEFFQKRVVAHGKIEELRLLFFFGFCAGLLLGVSVLSFLTDTSYYRFLSSFALLIAATLIYFFTVRS